MDLEINYFCENIILDYINKELINKSYDLDLLSAIGTIVEYNYINEKDISIEIKEFLIWFINNSRQSDVRKSYLVRIKEYQLLSILYKVNIIDDNYLEENSVKINKKYKHPLYKIYKEINE